MLFGPSPVPEVGKVCLSKCRSCIKWQVMVIMGCKVKNRDIKEDYTRDLWSYKPTILNIR